MINPMTVMKLLNERREFLDSNPHLYPFVKKWFAEDLEKGTVIEIRMIPPDKSQAETVRIEVNDSESGFFDALKQLFKA